MARLRVRSNRPVLHPLRKLIGIASFCLAGVAYAQNAAIVNNKPIPKTKLDDIVAQLVAQGRPDTPELRTAIRDSLIMQEIFLQEAEKTGVSQQAEVKRMLENQRAEILITAYLRDHLKKHPVSDADVKAEYDKLKSQQGDREFKARHILVEKEDQAKQIIEQLKKGGNFAEIAKKESKDPGSGANGGDLDWNPAGTFVKPFSDAMVKLAKGKYTEAPIQTQFGWHVIQVDDVRDAAPPPLDQVKPQITQELERRKVQKLQTDLRAKAKIQ
ncbi:MAG: peptidylprolyl isomerase [Betaproteobacteria bacterium]|nr:peptidylprolyl isomerase [Betaproteobacteria bacterium]